ncbi:hypothetical protein D8674_018209 [Pyrus ussuriensis x Pyrus communis]|uniref:Transmembrane protein 245-like n=1 Tax=Pyrus ussuriensis x Pyrus communis TaxID=2448454 RepID=A0A5N5G4S3_9ROSA|nr:hypothetical protein D8674_018209 [Pyrus ussuriensis x Pyrus communis]
MSSTSNHPINPPPPPTNLSCHRRHRRKKKNTHPILDNPDPDPHSEPESSHPPPPAAPEPEPEPKPQTEPSPSSPLPIDDPHVRIAMYVAMAHAGLAFSLALLYGVTKLLQGYWRPIHWAILCSMPLRELHTALVSFWSHSLNLGLFETLIAIPIAALRATTASLVDSHTAIQCCLLRRRPNCRKRQIRFSKLVQWIISFALFVIVYESIGIISVPAFAMACFVAYALGYRSILIDPGVATTLSAISSVRRRGRLKFKNTNNTNSNSNSPANFGGKISRCITSMMLNRLKTAVAIGLITVMIVGSVLGFFFFSYKIAIEGKGAVISLKAHLEEMNYDYAGRVGLKKWMNANQVPELIDDYATKFFETVSQNIDSLAAHYNVTEVVDSVRHYLSTNQDQIHNPMSNSNESGRNFSSSISTNGDDQPNFSEKFRGIQSRVRNREWGVIHRDIDGLFGEFMSSITREDLAEKTKDFLLQGLDLSRRVLASGTMVVAGGANLLFFMAVSLVSGAAGLFNFFFELTVFFWLLYYLITTDSGGVMDHVLGMLPLSKSTRVRCAQVLDHAVSSVLLAAAKVTFFQGSLTYLLFRFYQIHFLYMSTSLALMSAVLQITPAWFLSIPAVLQLAMEERYVEAVLVTVVHQILLEYGTAAIQDEIPGQNAYLTGLSILGGIALFPSMLEGAIMGPLLMTVMIAFKNLYVEFVLASGKEATAH